MMTIEIVLEAGNWPANIDALANEIEDKLFSHFGLDIENFETSILLTDDAHIQKLNQEFRDKDKPTDVLSWPSFEYDHEAGQRPKLPEPDAGPFAATLGDMALGFETCVKDAKDRNFDHHISHLILHGFLHLFGYDHEDDSDATLMENLEVEILKSMYINNPYLEN